MAARKSTTSTKSTTPRAGTSRTPHARTRARQDEHDWADLFFDCFESTGLVTEACRQVGVGRSTVYDRRANDEAFAARWKELEEQVVEEMEAEAYRRAVKGTVKELIYDGDGNVVAHVLQFSDRLMEFLLKARRPDVYRENVKVQHTGPDGGPVRHELDIAVPAVREHLSNALAAAQEAEGGARRD